MGDTMKRAFLMLAGIASICLLTGPILAQGDVRFDGSIDDDNIVQVIEIPEIAEGSTIIIDVRATSGDLDPVVALFYENNSWVIENDDREPGNSDPLLIYENAPAGDYFAIVTRYGYDEGSTSGEFSATVEIQTDAETPPLTEVTSTTVVDTAAAGYPDLPVAPEAEWTILAYLGADNNLEGGLLYDLDEFEVAGGSTEAVRVIALVDRAEGFDDSNGDWTGTYLYEVEADRSRDAVTVYPPTIDSRPLADLGELDTASDMTLLNFLVWGMRTYPAQRYAVILNDHGGGWAGTVTDDATPGHAIMSLPKVGAALERALSLTGVDRFDLLINDACLMSSVEFLSTIAPYVEVVFNSPEIMNNPGFDMTLFTRSLQEDPAIDLAELGERLAEKYMADMDVAFPAIAAFMGVVVTDLDETQPLFDSIDQFTQLVNGAPEQYSAFLGRVRSNTYTYSSFAQDYTMIDIGDFMRRVVQGATDSAIRSAAQQVLNTLDNAVLYSTAGDLLEQSTSFYNIYFPNASSLFNPRYLQQSPLKGWAEMLRAYFGALIPDAFGPDVTNSIPDVNITTVFPTSASVYTPVTIGLETVANNVAFGDFTADLLLEDGRSLRLNQSRIFTTFVRDDGSIEYLNYWRPGVDDARFNWSVTLPVVSDGVNTFNELVIQTDRIASLQGRYRDPGNTEWLEVDIIFDEFGNTDSIISRQADIAAFASVRPTPGGEFQSYYRIVNSDGRAEYVLGNLYTWPADGLTFEYRPAPTGTYNLGFFVQNFAGETGWNAVAVDVDNDNIDTAYRGLVEYDFGLNIIYPENFSSFTWYPEFAYEAAFNEDATEQLFIYPVAPTSIDLATIAREALARYEIEIETSSFRFIAVDGQDALEFTYVWSTDDNVFYSKGFAIYKPELNLGFVIAAETIDPARTEELYTLLITTTRIFNSLEIQQQDQGVWDVQTVTVDEDITASYPIVVNWAPPVTRDDGWRFYFADSDFGSPAFIGFRATPAQGDALAVLDAVEAELLIGLPDYTRRQDGAYYGEANTWQAREYSRTNRGVPVVGRVYATVIGDYAYTILFEAPSADFETYLPYYFVTLDGFEAS
jgi:hypothetical protein